MTNGRQLVEPEPPKDLEVPEGSHESDARILIDKLLVQSGWNPADKSQVKTEHSAGDRTRADYVLLGRNGRPLAVIEAKKDSIQPYTAREQALPYAKQLAAPFIFLSNGDLTYFWDYTQEDARIVNSFYSRRDLERLVYMRQQQKPLATIPIPEYYIRQGETRSVRPYQKETMATMDRALELGKRRFLIELPTGTGKTDLIALQLKRMIEAGRAERILFLVDRDQLAKQALDAIQDILNQYGSYWLKPGRVREEKQITVCLLQTMISRYNEFSSGYFDVVVMDESHRSIYGSWKTALTHFDALQIGLTATPAEYIERNTYQFYQCKDGEPDFAYPITKAFEEGYLVPYKFAKGITVLMADGADYQNDHLDPAQFERKWTNERTNRMMMEEFDRLAWENYKDLAPEQETGPGKSIIFAITKHHAARLCQYLNELHPELKGEYARVITSDIPNADELIRDFKKEKYPQVAVSVGMLDTGFDCPEVLHLVMARRVFGSPILYQQMRGRGTRTCPKIGKKKFVIYDFFGNHDYWNDSDTDIFTGGIGGHAPVQQRKPKKLRDELIELGIEDEWHTAVSYVEVGPEGERIDKTEYIERWEEAVRKGAQVDPIVQKIRKGDSLTANEEEDLSRKLNTPEFYFNEENLRRAYRNEERTLIDFIRAALGVVKVKSKEEEINENFNAWLATKAFTPNQMDYLSLLKNRGIARGNVDIEELFKPPLSTLNAAERGLELFGEGQLGTLIDEMNDEVFVKKAG